MLYHVYVSLKAEKVVNCLALQNGYFLCSSLIPNTSDLVRKLGGGVQPQKPKKPKTTMKYHFGY